MLDAVFNYVDPELYKNMAQKIPLPKGQSVASLLLNRKSFWFMTLVVVLLVYVCLSGINFFQVGAN